MRVIAYDTETCLIRPGVLAPELACLTWQRPGEEPRIVHHTDARTLFLGWLEGADLLIGHNVAYDMGVMGANFPDLVPAIFEAYAADRVTDTMIRQKLLDIAAGCYRGQFGAEDKWIQLNYSLFDLTRRHTGRLLEKDEWRLRYGEFRDVPLKDWPEGARMYPLDDARATLDVFLKQEEHADPYLVDQFRQTRKAWWLHLCSCWGLRTIPAAVARLTQETEALRDEVLARLTAAGLVRADGTRNLKAAADYMVSVCERDGITVRRTEVGNVSLDADACEATGDALLEDYAEFVTLGTVLNKDVKALEKGCEFPIHTKFDLAETGRTTSSKPNVQNWGRAGGTRETFVPRPGFVFIAGDVDQLELHTLAQVCVTRLGKSKLAEVLNAGKDPHSIMAAEIMGITYERAMELKEAGDPDFDNVRQTAKVANFGYPGGLGPAKLVKYARKSYGVDLGKGAGEQAAIEAARALKRNWLETWPEMEDYFAYIRSLQNPQTELYDLEQLFTGRRRGGARYTSACNSLFQGLGADAMARAGWHIARAQYVDRSSPLFGSRTVNFPHDEFLAETPDTPSAHDAAVELGRLMVAGGSELLPDVRLKVKPLITRVWSKKAKTVKGADGRLIAWEPSDNPKK